MEATFSDSPRVEARSTRTTLFELLKFAFSELAGVLVDGARGDAVDRLLTSSSSASFSALPRSQQDRLLDRGFRTP
jgi:hypothetical protein